MTSLDLRALFRLMDRQAGVVSRAQFNSLGGRHNDVERLVRREQIARFLPGVLIAPTDSPTWQQRAWGGVLHYWPAALAGESALRAGAGPGWRRYDDAAPITIAFSGEGSRRPLPGYDAHKLARLDERTDWDAGPPRLRPEEVGLDLAARTDDGVWAGVDALTTVVDLRGVTPATLRAAADRRLRLRNAQWLRPLLRDLDRGRPLLLERVFREQVEAAHGLPKGRRWRGPRGDRPDEPGITAIAYPPHRVRVELDGRIRHDSTGRHDRELEERLEKAVAAGHSRRIEAVLSWGQVFDRPCLTAARLGELLRQREWGGNPHACGRAGCALGPSS